MDNSFAMHSSINKSFVEADKVQEGLLLGSTIEVLRNPVAFLSKLAKNYGPVVYVHFLGRKYLVFQHPDYLKHVWLDNYKQYRKPGATKLLRLFLGEGLSTSNGELWLRQRRLMQPAFHSQKLVQITSLINEEVTTFIKRLQMVTDNTKIDISHELLQLTISIISRAMFSINLDKEMNIMTTALEELAAYAASWMKSLLKVPINWQTPANRTFKKNCRIFDSVIHDIIQLRKREMAKTGSPVYNDLLDLLLSFRDEETGLPMSDKLLRDEVTTIFMAGHETTAQTLGWMLYHLAKDKNIYQKVREEGVSVSSNQMLSFEDIPKLIYTKQVTQETLRMYPPIWAVVRMPLSDDHIHGLYVPKYSNILLNIYGLHHHPDYWEHPDYFYPEHFSAENEKQRPAFVFIPFGGGPRLCLGHNFAMLVMYVVISRITQSFQFDIAEGYTPEVEPNITLRARNGIQLLIKSTVA